MRFAILCPGQGGQHSGMFDLLPAARLAALFDAWGMPAALGMPLEQALDGAHLYANRVAQPLLVGGALACWELLKADLPRPDVVLGYSAGELAAHGIAGACAPETAVELAAARARLMDDCAGPGRPQGMLAVSGMRIARLRDLLVERGMHLAIETGTDSAIAGGLKQDLEHFSEGAAELGLHTRLLPVAVASHTPLMREAAATFAALLDTRLGAPCSPVLAGVSGLRVTNRAEAVDTLARQIAETILWTECMDACAEAGVTVALELGPCPALTRMLAARHPQIACRALSEFRSLAAAAAWVARQG